MACSISGIPRDDLALVMSHRAGELLTVMIEQHETVQVEFPRIDEHRDAYPELVHVAMQSEILVGAVAEGGDSGSHVDCHPQDHQMRSAVGRRPANDPTTAGDGDPGSASGRPGRRVTTVAAALGVRTRAIPANHFAPG
jgi:hypothetical protein